MCKRHHGAVTAQTVRWARKRSSVFHAHAFKTPVDVCVRVRGADMWGHLHRMASAAPEICRYNHNMSSDVKSWEPASPAPWVQTVEKRFWYASPSRGPFIGRFLGVHLAVHRSLASWDRSAIRYEALFAAAVALAVALQARARYARSRSTSARRAGSASFFWSVLG